MNEKKYWLQVFEDIILASFFEFSLYRLNLSVLATRESQTLAALMFYLFLRIKSILKEEKEDE